MSPNFILARQVYEMQKKAKGRRVRSNGLKNSLEARKLKGYSVYNHINKNVLMHTNNNSLDINFNTEWLSPKQAAAYLRITTSPYRKLLKAYSGNLEGHLKTKKSSGRTGQTTFISKQGLIVLATIKDSSRNGATDAHSAKQQIAEKAIEAVTLSDDPLIRQMQREIELRKQQIEQEKRIGSVEHRVDLIESDKFEAQQSLFALPAPKVPAPIRTDRSLIVECIRQYVQKTHGSGKDYALAWDKLFTECNYRFNTNLTTRVKHTGKSKLDLLEDDGALIQVYAIACEIFKS